MADNLSVIERSHRQEAALILRREASETFDMDLDRALRALADEIEHQGTITEQVVERVMADLMGSQVALVGTLHPDVRDGYMDGLRSHVRRALERALYS